MLPQDVEMIPSNGGETMAEMLHRYYTDHTELAVLCQDCARRRRQTSERCEWAETPVDWEQAALSC